jgi:hypothetical protein
LEVDDGKSAAFVTDECKFSLEIGKTKKNQQIKQKEIQQAYQTKTGLIEWKERKHFDDMEYSPSNVIGSIFDPCALRYRV